MSEHYRLYALKMAQRQATRRLTPTPLRGELLDLLEHVRECERIWRIEDRIERSLR